MGKKSLMVFVLLASSLVQADAYVIDIVARNSSEDTPPKNSILVVRDDASGEIHEYQVTIPGTIEVDSPNHGGTFSVNIRDDGWWSPQLQMGPDRAHLTLPVFPAGKVTGTLSPPNKKDKISAFSVRFANDMERFLLSRNKQQETAPDSGQGRCTLTGRAFECVVPAGGRSLRLRASGYASHYLRFVRIEPEETKDMGAIKLTPGSSVVGWIEAIDGAVIPADCSVSIYPQGLPSEKGMLNRSWATPLDNGFFHITDVGAGVYTLEVSGSKITPAVMHGLSLRDGFELKLHSPILVGPPVTLDGVISPPVGPGDSTWSIQMFCLDPARRDVMYSTTADPAGVWAIPEIQLGKYLLEVQVSTETEHRGVFTQTVAVEETSPLVYIDLDIVEIEGSVSWGNEPVPATVWFGGPRGVPSLEFAADSKGKFSGWLANDGWWPVHVEYQEENIKRSLRVNVEPTSDGSPPEVHLHLPATEIVGRVEDERGNPVPDSLVRLQALRTSEMGQVDVPVANDGSFVARGLPEGPVNLYAEAKDRRRSDENPVTLSEDSQLPEIVLVVREKREITGIVRSPTSIVPGARVSARIAGVLLSGSTTTTSNAEGRFTLRLPMDGNELWLVVEAMGRCLTTARFGIGDSEPTHIDVFVPEVCGQLVIDFPTSRIASGESTLLVKGVGGFLSLNTMTGWASMHASGSVSGAFDFHANPTSPVEVPELAPGPYTACLLDRLSSEWAAFLLTGIPGGDHCAAGILTEYGTLTLGVEATE